MTKFKDSKFGKLLTNRFVKMGIKSIPFVGGPLGNLLDDTTERVKEITKGMRGNEGSKANRSYIDIKFKKIGSEPGTLTGDEWTALIASVILGGLLIYALITGDWESAEKGKDFIGN